MSDSVDYLLAAENWTWASFPYDAYLGPERAQRRAESGAIGADWLASRPTAAQQ